jgi:25S rRNA (cytosine2278-C5)-methyltransferase
MSLYYEAAEILEKQSKTKGPLKSLVYSNKNLKSNAASLYALLLETAKWSEVLKGVVESSGILKLERKVNDVYYLVLLKLMRYKLSPTLAILLAHDLLLSKKGIAAPAGHGLRSAIERHKARIQAEFTKARIRARCVTLEAFRETIETAFHSRRDPNVDIKWPHPRWVRINTLCSTLEEELNTTFSEFETTKDLGNVMSASALTKVLYIDNNIPDLIALPPKADLTKSQAYRSGKIIFQDKASCFPAYLLAGASITGDVIDACAAPGNKTTHLAALVSSYRKQAIRTGKVLAFEKDENRSQVLRRMVKLADADQTVVVSAPQDFLKIDPTSNQYRDVTALLLDPSCSGSGIVGRDDADQNLQISLPELNSTESLLRGKKRKRRRTQSHIIEDDSIKAQIIGSEVEAVEDDGVDEETQGQAALQQRLESLSSFQLRLLTHAMSFPNARKISYSTCSIHIEENEKVVVRALNSSVAKEQGWHIMKRSEQPEGMAKWHVRGIIGSQNPCSGQAVNVPQDVADACIRCEKGSQDGTMGFFVAGFVRNPEVAEVDNGDDSEEEWNGFSDED